MDPYTLKTKNWLDQRFANTTPDGVYLSHQPIYGYLKGHCDDGDYITCYNRVYHSLRALKTLQKNHNSMLDVGAAEGFTSHLAKTLLGLDAECCDLSDEACGKAKAIFGLPAQQADIHNLPYENGSFDFVLCNETIEHLSDPMAGAKELIRVARKAVVITVPHEPLEKIMHNREVGEEHAHINSFDLSSFDQVAMDHGCRVVFRKAFQHRTTNRVGKLLVWPLKSHSQHSRYPKFLYSMYHRMARIAQILLGKALPAFAILRDYRLYDTGMDDIGDFGCLLFIISKDPKCHIDGLKTIDVLRLVGQSVPFYYPSRSTDS